MSQYRHVTASPQQHRAAAHHVSPGGVSKPAVMPRQLLYNIKPGIAPVQGVFYWADHPHEVVDDNDNENADGMRALTKKGFQKKFLTYANEKLLDLENIREADLQRIFTDAFNGTKAISLGNKGANLVDPLINWLRTNIKAIRKNYEYKPRVGSITGKKRKQYNPKPVAGEATGVPRRVKMRLTREFSVAEGMLHAPVFSHGGDNVTKYTHVEGNGTYSIGAYAVEGGNAHLLAGSKSGEKFGGGPVVKMHAEEQQIAAFEDQVAQNAHGLGDAFATNKKVVLYLHISKSPCSKQCQGIFDTLLSKYPGLEIQLYLENLYKANNPALMKEEAIKLKALMEKYPGRLAYKIVSTQNAKTALSDPQHPMKKLGGLEDIIFESIVSDDKSASLADTRRKNFTDLISQGHFPPESFVDSLK
ncbi:hypothetical protein [Chitinophaga sp. GbtcB8]|uniref:hypothetical protein n=1 Tax=Chitinophaga sp. GbtcB8 TaxID=2824753 RepID=UPI001C2FB3ED|nr:hypothetical protein [Chitinophaga sp. GbtcB8]